MVNFELLFVDDGSKDTSGSLCDEWAKKDGRIKVIHKKNGGVSDARNAGIKVATGKYISFVDSDDYIETSYLQDIWNETQNYDADVIFIGYNKVNENGTKEVFLPGEVLETNIKTALALSEHDMFGYTWIKAFRRDSTPIPV